jgi:hypothetical protein
MGTGRRSPSTTIRPSSLATPGATFWRRSANTSRSWPPSVCPGGSADRWRQVVRRIGACAAEWAVCAAGQGVSGVAVAVGQQTQPGTGANFAQCQWGPGGRPAAGGTPRSGPLRWFGCCGCASPHGQLTAATGDLRAQPTVGGRDTPRAAANSRSGCCLGSGSCAGNLKTTSSLATAMARCSCSGSRRCPAPPTQLSGYVRASAAAQDRVPMPYPRECPRTTASGCASRITV